MSRMYVRWDLVTPVLMRTRTPFQVYFSRKYENDFSEVALLVEPEIRAYESANLKEKDFRSQMLQNGCGVVQSNWKMRKTTQP